MISRNTSLGKARDPSKTVKAFKPYSYAVTRFLIKDLNQIKTMLRSLVATRKSNQGLTGLTFGLTLSDRVKSIANTRYYGVPIQRMNV